MSNEKVNNEETDDELYTRHVQDRIDEEAKGIVSNVDPETLKYYADLAKQMGIGDDKHE